MVRRAKPNRKVVEPPIVHRWDLDKTYLRTDFDKLRDLIRVPFQTAADKVVVPGVPELIRALQQHARRRGSRAFVYFISASPPQLAKSIREKFALDGVEIDGIVFKDQLHILMRGKLRGLREQTGFKLTELLRGRLAAPPEASEYLFGDDWEADPIIYSLYADAVAGRLDPDELDRLLAEVPVDREWRAAIGALLLRISRADAVRRIFINLERRTPPGAFRVFGPRVVPAFNYFQTAACLYEEGRLDASGVELVGRRLIAAEGYSREMLENSLGDVARRGHLGSLTHERLAEELRGRELLPGRRRPLGLRWRKLLQGWRRRRRLTEAPAASELDYASIFEGWRAER